MAAGTDLGFVVSHTHWDRAWYLPFESCRHRLIGFLDELLDILEGDRGFRSFMLDGQSVVLEDYLAIRPENGRRIRALVRAGRLFIGPWYTLPDLFLSGGEAVVRNLQLGRAGCAPFGGAMPVGYVPDPFGHFAQMPQVLRGFGLDSYVFMRGMDAATVKRLGSIFDWRSPDGSSVLAVNLPSGYLALGALGHPAPFGRFDGRKPTAAEALARVKETLETLRARQSGRSFLLLNGCDHMPAQPELPVLLRKLNRRLKSVRLIHASLPDFMKSRPAPRGTFTGDLIGNADHPILLGVYSSRMVLKRLNHRAQSALQRQAEPLCAAFGGGALLEHAWKTLLKCHAHDDLCGCSADPVHAEDEVRFLRVEETADALVAENLERMKLRGLRAARGGGAELFVFNPHPFGRRSRVEAEVLFPAGREGAPLRALSVSDERGRPLPARMLFAEAGVVRSAFLETTWGRRYRFALELDIPPTGYRILSVREGRSPWRPAPPSRLEKARVEELLSFEYEMDGGDTYSFGPLPFGPWRARLLRASPGPEALRLEYALKVPARLDRRRMAPAGSTTLRLSVDARQEGRTLALRIRCENTARDGRLRALLRTGLRSGRAVADAPFMLSERTRPAPSKPSKSPYPGEREYPTQHQGDFLILEEGGLRAFIANRGNPEYELGEDGVRVTLHRAVGWLSVAGGGIRDCQAGPSIPVPGAQCQRVLEHDLGIGIGRMSRAEAVREALAFSHPARARELPRLPYAPKSGPVPRSASFLEVRNPAIALSALRPAGSGYALRLYNLTGTSQTTELVLGLPASRWCPCGLDERWDERSAKPLRGPLRVDFEPYQIRTLLFSKEARSR
ncbi:MAG TPA: glycoside hydrolase [Elusimicrobia bacterium]|nr:glycoside hydrolase [Elusimicrobiota bacterium]